MSTAAANPPAAGQAAVAHRGMITISIMLATIMQALDTTIANVALPHMQGSLQASQDQITWVLTSYIVASAIAAPLDKFGFITLSLAIGLLQMFLDRGELLDWFDSREIQLEAAGALVAFAFFAVHTWTVQGASFFNRDLLKDRNFVTGMLFGFIVGAILFGTMALLPTF